MGRRHRAADLGLAARRLAVDEAIGRIGPAAEGAIAVIPHPDRAPVAVRRAVHHRDVLFALTAHTVDPRPICMGYHDDVLRDHLADHGDVTGFHDAGRLEHQHGATPRLEALRIAAGRLVPPGPGIAVEL